MSDRAAFVTGAASGLGRAIALRLASEGIAVAIADLDPDGAAKVAAEVEAEGTKATAVTCDVADLEAVRVACEDAQEVLGGFDILVNNAGFDSPAFFLQSDPTSWQRLVDVNMMGVLNCTYVLAPVIAAATDGSGTGRIVNIASDAGRVGSLGEPVYSAAKGGVIAFTKAMARELARDQITVNAVCPGPADTPMTDTLRRTELGARMMERMVRATPLRRLVQPEEVAAAVAYFVSDDARFTTAQILSVSGGLTIPG